MRLQILVPSHIVFDNEVARITAEGVSGSFGILQNHIDFVEPLSVGILSIRREGKDMPELFVALNGGLLVKERFRVMISTPEAILSEHLSHLVDTVEQEFLEINERERKTRSAMARLESDFIRRFIE